MDNNFEKTRVLIVDDETHARRTLRQLLEKKHPNFSLEEACDGVEAVEKIVTFQPELVFLDIEMPAASGFDVLRAYPNRNFEVIFVTAFSHFAIEAFDACACDYLLKPVQPARFESAVLRACEHLKFRTNRLAKLNSFLLATEHYLDSFFARQGVRATQIFSRDIILISVDEGGTSIFTTERAFITDMTLAYFEEHLDPRLFRRVRRNIIVHRAAISKVLHLFPMVLVMENGAEVTVAKERRAEVRCWLEENAEGFPPL